MMWIWNASSVIAMTPLTSSTYTICCDTIISYLDVEVHVCTVLVLGVMMDESILLVLTVHVCQQTWMWGCASIKTNHTLMFACIHEYESMHERYIGKHISADQHTHTHINRLGLAVSIRYGGVWRVGTRGVCVWMNACTCAHIMSHTHSWLIVRPFFTILPTYSTALRRRCEGWMNG